MLDKFNALRADMAQCLIERESAITNAITALLTGQHYLLLGPPGTAKSLLARQLTQRIDNAALFEVLLTPFSVPEEVFGPIDLMGYANHGQYKRISAGSLSEAHIAFIDEVYKANSAILNSLLTVMNERLLHEVGQQPKHLPLISIIAASNETPSDSGLQALDDRFLIREIIEYVGDDNSFIQMMTRAPESSIKRKSTFVSLDDIRQAQTEVCAVQGTPETMQAILTLREALSKEGVVVSDRKWRQTLSVVKATAWLDDRDATTVEDICALRFCLWNNPKDRKTVETQVYTVANPLHLKALQYQDQAEELIGNLPTEGDYNYSEQLENTLLQLSDIHERLMESINLSTANDKTRSMQALDKVAALHKKASASMFKSVSRLALRSV